MDRAGDFIAGLSPFRTRVLNGSGAALPELRDTSLLRPSGDIRLKEFSKPHLLRVGERAVRIRTAELA